MRGRDSETEKCNVYRMRLGVSIHHCILPIRSSGVWCTILCLVHRSIGPNSFIFKCQNRKYVSSIQKNIKNPARFCIKKNLIKTHFK